LPTARWPASTPRAQWRTATDLDRDLRHPGWLAVGQNPRPEPRRHLRCAPGRSARRLSTSWGVLHETNHFVDAVLDDFAPALALTPPATRIAIALRESLQSRRVVDL
jgi:hypothetical protein